MSDKPEILISDGKVEYHGSANNTEYHFKSDDYEYVFFINYVGPMDMKPYEFGIFYKTVAKITSVKNRHVSMAVINVL